MIIPVGNARLWALLLGVAVSADFPARPSAQEPSEPQYDLLIVHGKILDGSGSPWFEGSVGIKDGKVADIGRLRNVTAKRVIDAAGLTIAPGFIDLHGHSGYTLLVDGTAQSKIRQGVTTEPTFPI